ncbi:hypothetical protein DJ031_04505 [bacterium endosymbiont of Escarpia laminata]|nr:MAG: hypothetical protein DJ031_04505 [bacterium endosymbiont of Escarpia laminata]
MEKLNTDPLNIDLTLTEFDPEQYRKNKEICTGDADPLESELERMPDSAYHRYCKKHYALIEKMQDVGLPKPGEQFRLVTRRTFNAIQVLEYIANQEAITDLKIVIFSINFHAATKLMELIDAGKIKNVEILMSNLRNKAHREKEVIMKKMFMDHPRIKIFFCSSHAKAFSCRTTQGNFYTLEGSGNMAYNSRVEQYVIDNDQGMYEFTCRWMADIKQFLSGKKELEVCE